MAPHTRSSPTDSSASPWQRTPMQSSQRRMLHLCVLKGRCGISSWSATACCIELAAFLCLAVLICMLAASGSPYRAIMCTGCCTVPYRVNTTIMRSISSSLMRTTSLQCCTTAPTARQRSSAPWCSYCLISGSMSAILLRQASHETTGSV